MGIGILKKKRNKIRSGPVRGGGGSDPIRSDLRSESPGKKELRSSTGPSANVPGLVVDGGASP